MNVAKALESGTQKFLSQVVDEEMKTFKYDWFFSTLSGGMIADEVSKKHPIAADIACKNLMIAQFIQSAFETPNFKINLTNDVMGVELAGSLKNVIAIGAGLFDGLDYGASSKSAFICEAANEMKQFAILLGAQSETFESTSQSWFGDLLTTCFGKSRNRYLGELIGSGMTVNEALSQLESEHKLSEGYLSSKSFYLLSKKMNSKTPMLDTIYGILHEEKSPKDAITEFWSRSKI